MVPSSQRPFQKRFLLRSTLRSCFRPCLEMLEDRTLLTVTLLNHYTGLNFDQSGGYIPPDSQGAAGTSSYVQTINQELAIFTPKATGATSVSDDFADFWFKQGSLPLASSSSALSDPIVVWDDQIHRFIVGDQDVDFTTHVSRFDLAVSRSDSPATLTSVDWKFYSIATTENGYDADYPGNFGYNHDAFVFTLNMFNIDVNGPNHVQVNSISINDLAAGASAPQKFQFIIANAISLRPTVMHDSVAGDPMWFVEESGSDTSIVVYKVAGILTSSRTVTPTTLFVTKYGQAVIPVQPGGTTDVLDIDSRILKSAEWNHTIVATHTVSPAANEDDARWYRIDVSGSTPVLKDQGTIRAGPNTYITYPGIDINASGQIGMSYMQCGSDAPTDFLSVYVTGRLPTDPGGTMEPPVLVQPGVQNYVDFGTGGQGARLGDLSGINTDSDGSFWIANEFADNEDPSLGADWGIAIGHFAIQQSGVPPAVTPPSNQNALEGKSVTVSLGSFTDSDGGPWTVDVNWGDGTTDTHFAESAAGSLGNQVHSYTEDGSYSVSITVTDAADSQPGTGMFQVSVSDQNVVATGGLTLNATEGAVAAPQAVATFTDPGGSEAMADYTATISWGDGSSATTGTISQSGTTFTVQGGHSYAEEGSYTISVTINHNTSTPQVVTSMVSISDPNVVGLSASISATAGAPFSGMVATFTDPGAAETNDGSHYSASIAWGDNTLATTGIITVANGTFTVNGTHTYAAAGSSYSVTVTINHEGTAIPVQETATVTNLGQIVSAGLIKPISFWAGLQGQSLIHRFGLTSGNLTLGQWLATTYPNLYGGTNGAPNLSPFTPAQISSYYQSLFLASKGVGLDAELLATALETFTTTASLGGSAGQSYGFTVNNNGLGAYSWNIGASGQAFGVSNNTVLNVDQILLAANNSAVGGEPWGSNTLFRNEAFSVFHGINGG
ncbi:MAG TPA: PKD domain-containing protein [Gemmataceae bacterium]|nr:PKD domain-containing protein [Gemmataceae bacterium]